MDLPEASHCQLGDAGPPAVMDEETKGPAARGPGAVCAETGSRICEKGAAFEMTGSLSPFSQNKHERRAEMHTDNGYLENGTASAKRSGPRRNLPEPSFSPHRRSDPCSGWRPRSLPRAPLSVHDLSPVAALYDLSRSRHSRDAREAWANWQLDRGRRALKSIQASFGTRLAWRIALHGAVFMVAGRSYHGTYLLKYIFISL